MKEILIETISELYRNILYLESKLSSPNLSNKEVAKSLLKHGICFVRYKIDSRVVFAPSRFIGYKNNNFNKHTESKTKHGTSTNVRIKRILGSRAESNTKIEKEYLNFCKSYEIIPRELGSFGEPRKYWDLEKIKINIYGELELPEGRKILKMHYLRERNPRIRQMAIDNFLVKNKRLFCEACEFNFADTYGKLGSGFIECHHKLPLSKMPEKHLSKPSDLILLCSNCHRMIHKRQPWLTLKQLKKHLT